MGPATLLCHLQYHNSNSTYLSWPHKYTHQISGCSVHYLLTRLFNNPQIKLLHTCVYILVLPQRLGGMSCDQDHRKQHRLHTSSNPKRSGKPIHLNASVGHCDIIKIGSTLRIKNRRCGTSNTK